MKKATILIVETDQKAALDLGKGLEAYHCSTVQTLSFGDDLNFSIGLHKPDLILAGISSLEHLEGLLPIKPWLEDNSRPLIVLTPSLSSEFVREIKNMPASMILTKPPRLPELAINISLCIENAQNSLNPMAQVFNKVHGIDINGFKQRIGAMIKSLRLEKKLTQAAAAEQLGINYRYYQDIEAGKANLKIDTILKITKGMLL